MRSKDLILNKESAMTFYEMIAPFETQLIDAPLTSLIKIHLRNHPVKVLEAGCGNGKRARLFATMGCDVTAVDLSADMVRVATAWVRNKAEVLRADCGEMPFDDNDFEVTTLILTLEFVKDPGKVLMECIRVTKRQIIIANINPISPLGLKLFWNRFLSTAHLDKLNLFNKISLRDKISHYIGTHRFNYVPTKSFFSSIYFSIIDLTYDKYTIMQPVYEIKIKKEMEEITAIACQLNGGKDERSIFI